MFASTICSSDHADEQGAAGDSGSNFNQQDNVRWRAHSERADGSPACANNELTALAAPRKQASKNQSGKKTRESEFQSLLGYALEALARREHSSVELRRKLDVRASGETATGRSQQHIDQVIEALMLDGSLSDERFAAEYVRIRVAKGFGPLRIRMELIERGVPDRLAEEHLTRPAEFWQEQAALVCQQKFAGLLEELHQGIGDQGIGDGVIGDGGIGDGGIGEKAQQRWNRCARFLSQRGFPADLIYRTLDGRLLE